MQALPRKGTAALLAAALLALGAAPTAGAAPAAGRDSAAERPIAHAAMVRREHRWWTYYLPNGRWQAAPGAQGIDISSPTGSLYVGHGFAGSPLPLTHAEVRGYLVRTGALDLHPLRRLRLGRFGRARVAGAVSRRVLRFTARRTDRRENVRGVLTVDVIRDDATLTYGIATYVRVAPARSFRRVDPMLARVQRLIFLKPRDPWTHRTTDESLG